MGLLHSSSSTAVAQPCGQGQALACALHHVAVLALAVPTKWHSFCILQLSACLLFMKLNTIVQKLGDLQLEFCRQGVWSGDGAFTFTLFSIGKR